MKKFIFNDKLYLFRMTDGKIYCTDTLSGASEVIFEDAAGDFDISCDKNGSVYVLCQNSHNYFYILKREAGGWSQSCILESSSREIYDKKFSLISSGQLQSAFYVLKKQSGCALIHHILSDNNVPEVVAEFPSQLPYFVLGSPSGNIYCIYYQDGFIGYKVFKWQKKQWSEFSNLCEEHGTPGFISAVYNYGSDTIHIAYSASHGGRHRVMYIGAHTHEIISNGYTPIYPAIFINDEIHIMFNFAGRLLISKSRDDGASFTPPKYFYDGSFAKKDLTCIKLRDYGNSPELSDCLCYGCELPDGTFSLCSLDNKVKALKKPKQSFFAEQQNEVESFAGITPPEVNPELERLNAEIERLKNGYENNFDKKLIEVIAKRLDDIELRLSAVEKTEEVTPTELIENDSENSEKKYLTN